MESISQISLTHEDIAFTSMFYVVTLFIILTYFAELIMRYLLSYIVANYNLFPYNHTPLTSRTPR